MKETIILSFLGYENVREGHIVALKELEYIIGSLTGMLDSRCGINFLVCCLIIK